MTKDKTFSVPVADLEVSPDNVRKTSNKTALDELKSSIKAHGVLQNLTIIQKPLGGYQVIAGGQRLLALQQLIKEGALPKGQEVMCTLQDIKDAKEISLAENVTRQAMNPADEFEAFAALVAKGVPISTIALNFGKTQRYVEGRLRLAKLDPLIVKALRVGGLTFEKACAFTLTDDTKLQVKIFKELSDYDDVDDIKRRFIRDCISQNDALVRYVGVEAYEAAGGKCLKDLFGDVVIFQNEKLLLELAEKKAAPDVEKVRKQGWKWVEVSFDYDHFSKISNGCQQIYDKITKKDEKALAGCILRVTGAGKIDIEEGYLRKEDAAAFKKLRGKNDTSVSSKQTGKVKGELTQAATDSLLLQRQQIMQFAIAGNPAVAEGVLHFAVVESMLQKKTDFYRKGTADGIAITFEDEHVDQFAKNAAFVQLNNLKGILDLSWCKSKKVQERYAAFIALPEANRAKLVAFATAQCVTSALKGDDSFIEHALSLCNVNVAEKWRPTKENYLQGVSRDALMKIGSDIFKGNFAEKYKSAKKSDLVDLLDKVFAGKGTLTDAEAKKRADSWLPKEMPFEAAKVTAKTKKAA